MQWYKERKDAELLMKGVEGERKMQRYKEIGAELLMKGVERDRGRCKGIEIGC